MSSTSLSPSVKLTVTQPADFFRSGNGAALPDTLNDVTEAIGRTGFTGLGTNLPLSTSDVVGSTGYTIANTVAVAYTASASVSVINLTLAALQTVTLPAASGVTRRVYTIVNSTAVAKVVSSYTSLLGTASTVIPANSSIDLQSDGLVWRQISGEQAGVDFFRSASGTALPDGVADATEAVGRTGSTGLGTNDPLSTADLAGSVGYAVVNTAAAAYPASATDSVINLTLAGAQAVTLPAAAGVARRTYTITNPTGTAKTISTYTSLLGATSTIVLANAVLVIQSDGTIWRQIAGGIVGATIKQERTGIVNVGDVGAGTTASVGGDILTAVKTSPFLGAQSTLDVTFTPAMPSNNYFVYFSAVSLGTPADDVEVKMPVAFNRTTTGFSFRLEEQGSAAQNLLIGLLIKAF